VANDRLVYSTDSGDHRRNERHPSTKGNPKGGPQLPNDGVVRVFREKGGRGGKTVTVVRGLRGDLAAVASDLKRHCGSGGSVKEDTVEIQGDHRDKIVMRLREAGHVVKAAGG
jgi:translation initiation factor 1